MTLFSCQVSKHIPYCGSDMVLRHCRQEPYFVYQRAVDHYADPEEKEQPGLLYWRIEDGRKQHPSQAIRLLELAIQQASHPSPVFCLADCSKRGEGVGSDTPLGVTFYNRAVQERTKMHRRRKRLRQANIFLLGQ